MFTGIVEEIGRIERISQQGKGIELTITAERILTDIHLGDSISVNGVCLTAVRFTGQSFTVDVVPETMRRSNLGEFIIGTPVNLERAMSAEGRFGGHFVSGHIDDTGKIIQRVKEDNAVVFHIQPESPAFLKYVIDKGSISIDGISLTVMAVKEHSFSVSIIPHTLEQTVLQFKFPGSIVNLEFDLIGKYLERLLLKRGEPAQISTGLTEHFLRENGF